MSKSKHRFRGAAKRNEYALVLSPKMGWVRVFRFSKNDIRLLPL
jgi:hypothetical protein